MYSASSTTITNLINFVFFLISCCSCPFYFLLFIHIPTSLLLLFFIFYFCILYLLRLIILFLLLRTPYSFSSTLSTYFDISSFIHVFSATHASSFSPLSSLLYGVCFQTLFSSPSHSFSSSSSTNHSFFSAFFFLSPSFLLLFPFPPSLFCPFNPSSSFIFSSFFFSSLLPLSFRLTSPSHLSALFQVFLFPSPFHLALLFSFFYPPLSSFSLFCLIFFTFISFRPMIVMTLRKSEACQSGIHPQTNSSVVLLIRFISVLG